MLRALDYIYIFFPLVFFRRTSLCPVVPVYFQINLSTL